MKTIANEDRDRVYYDTNIWVAHMLGEEDHSHQLCKPMIDAVEHEQSTVVVSNLIILELIHVVRRRISQKYAAKEGIPASKIEYVAEEIIDNFTKTIGRFVRQRKAVFVNPMESIAAHQSLLLTKLKVLTKYAKLESHCNSCQRSYVVGNGINLCPLCGTAEAIKKKHTYRGLGHIDLEHAFVAIRGRASIFYTMDKGFSALKNDPSFSSIVFKQL